MNPCNNGSYHGWLLKEPTYIKNKEEAWRFKPGLF